MQHYIFVFLFNVISKGLYMQNELYFRISATFEMIRTESDEICISIDQDCGGAAPFIRREIKQGSG